VGEGELGEKRSAENGNLRGRTVSPLFSKGVEMPRQGPGSCKWNEENEVSGITPEEKRGVKEPADSVSSSRWAKGRRVDPGEGPRTLGRKDLKGVKKGWTAEKEGKEGK